jgi:hypothetical protein
MKKVLRPDSTHNPPPPPEILEELAHLLAGPDGTVELTPDGWVYENPYGSREEKP